MNPIITAFKGIQAAIITGAAFIAGSYIAPLIGVDQQIIAGVVTTLITGGIASFINFLKNHKR